MFKKPPTMNDLVDSLIAPKINMKPPKNEQDFLNYAKKLGDNFRGNGTQVAAIKPSDKNKKKKKQKISSVKVSTEKKSSKRKFINLVVNIKRKN